MRLFVERGGSIGSVGGGGEGGQESVRVSGVVRAGLPTGWMAPPKVLNSGLCWRVFVGGVRVVHLGRSTCHAISGRGVPDG